jgi:hypothetical protein
MFSTLIIISSLFLAPFVGAQCSNPEYTLCYGSGSTFDPPPAPSSSSGSGGGESINWGPLQSVASLPIGKKRRNLADDPASRLTRRSNLESRDNVPLCCAPSPVECLQTEGYPFCYVSITRISPFVDSTLK